MDHPLVTEVVLGGQPQELLDAHRIGLRVLPAAQSTAQLPGEHAAGTVAEDRDAGADTFAGEVI